jgi:signal transduction histidine kinase
MLMTALPARLAPAAWLRVPRTTARLRLTMLYGALFLASGVILLAVTYLLFGQATGVIDLPGGGQVVFGDLSGAGGPGGSPRPSPGATPPTGRPSPSFSPSGSGNPAQGMQFAQHLQIQITQLRAFELHELVVRSCVALGIMALISVALGWLVAGRVLRPVRTISAAARRIGAGNLHARLGLDGPHDEFHELAATLDDLLERLEAAFESQRRFVANALLERALRRHEPTEEFWRATCRRLLVSSQQQNRTIDALLTLARSEAGLSAPQTFELARVLDSVLLSPELDLGADAPQVNVTELGRAPITGDPRLIERLVRNLIDNALRYNRPSGRVDVTVDDCSGRAVLIVANTGPTVPPGEIDHLFEPFQRLTPARSGNTGGTGLGLSIVKAIADAHDATITATPHRHGGLRITVAFPFIAGHVLAGS